MPGTAADSNWSQRLHLTVETLVDEPEYQAFAAELRAMVQQAGRTVPATV